MNAEFLFFCLITSFQITAIHVACWQGMILFGARNKAAKFLFTAGHSWLEKPLYDCLPCMASVWGLLFWWFDGLNYNPIQVVLCVSGINCLIQCVVNEEAA